MENIPSEPKIGVSALICDAGEALNILRDEGSQLRGFAIVASTQGLRPPRVWEFDEIRGFAAELARFLRAKESEDRLIDLLVMDEAHHSGRQYSRCRTATPPGCSW